MKKREEKLRCLLCPVESRSMQPAIQYLALPSRHIYVYICACACVCVAQTVQQRQWMIKRQASGQAGGQAMLGNKDYREESCISKGKYCTFLCSNNFGLSNKY
jgi:hypothetical protein